MVLGTKMNFSSLKNFFNEPYHRPTAVWVYLLLMLPLTLMVGYSNWSDVSNFRVYTIWYFLSSKGPHLTAAEFHHDLVLTLSLAFGYIVASFIAVACGVFEERQRQQRSRA